MTDFFITSTRYGFSLAIAMALSGLATTSFLTPQGAYLAFEDQHFDRQLLPLISVAIVAGICGAAIELQGNKKIIKAVRWLLLALLSFAAFKIGKALIGIILPSPIWLKGIVFLAAVVFSVMIINTISREKYFRMIEAVTIGLLISTLSYPGVFSYVQGKAYAILINHTHPLINDIPPKSPKQVSVIVVVLDEMDYEIADRFGFFASSQMKELLQKAYFSSNASPAGTGTINSIPAMMTGQHFGEIVHASPQSLVGTSGAKWNSGELSLMDDILANGYRVAIRGFHHDYCGVLTKVADCMSIGIRTFPGWISAFGQAIPIANTYIVNSRSPDSSWWDTYARLEVESVALLEKGQADFYWFHINVPHLPRLAKSGEQWISLSGDYQANLKIAEQFLEKIKDAADHFDQPYRMIITSDHGLRELWKEKYESLAGKNTGQIEKKDGDQRVPFIVYFSDATQGVVDTQQISTLGIRRLSNAIFKKTVNSPRDVKKYLQ